MKQTIYITRTLFVISAAVLILAGCRAKKPGRAAGKPGEWLSQGILSVKVEKAELEDFYNPHDQTGMTLGMPKFNIEFLVRNDSERGVSIGVINCEFLDGDSRSLGQVILRESENTLGPGESAEFTTDTDGYHLNPEKCSFIIRPKCGGFSGEFVFDISIPLDPERSRKEAARRKELDEFEKELREGRTARNKKPRASELNIQRPELGEPEVLKIPKDTPLIQQKVTMYQKPPFFKGNVPYEFTAFKLMLYQNNYLTLMHDFGGWKNLYIYSDTSMKFSGIAEGAKTLDRDNNLVAEAKLSKLIKGEGIEIEEFHLNPGGKVTFYCKSRYSFGLGEKESETDVKGKKEKDYYFIWPTSSSF